MPTPKIKVEAVAKAEVIGKATYQRKHSTTTVVPPDVTRAKAGAWLNLISPITEWAGLKGDALNFKRSLLRIQQEETLLRVAQEVQRKLAGADILRHVPRKIFVPALEKASLEDVDDHVMIDRWANLLASAATDVKVQPRFVGILEEMTGQQAKCLERIAFNRYTEVSHPAVVFGDSFINFAEHNIWHTFVPEIRKILTSEKHVDAAFAEIENTFQRPGVLLRLSTINGPDDSWIGYDFVTDTKIDDESDLSILESLGLVRYVALEIDVLPHKKKRIFEVSVYYYHLTKLGIEFCEVCSKPRVDDLRLINAASRRKNTAS